MVFVFADSYEIWYPVLVYAVSDNNVLENLQRWLPIRMCLNVFLRHSV